MTERHGNYVYKIDRDDCLDNWLKKQPELNMTNGLFFEYDMSKTNYFKIVAGIDYFSKTTGFNVNNIQRHQLICNTLKVPYFCIQVLGKIYVNDKPNINNISYLKAVTGYSFIFKNCNSLGQNILKQLNLKDYILTEQQFSDLLHTLRNIPSVPILSSSDVYSAYLSCDKIARERHACYGKGMYQSDIDLILYSQITQKPIMIVEFKANICPSNAYRNVYGQTQLLNELERRLKIPIIKIWHPDSDITQFNIVKYYNNLYKFRQINYRADELIAEFKSYCNTQ